MAGDVQLTALAVHAAPLDYVVPANAMIRVKSVKAEFRDNSAGGDWLPAVEFISDAGLSGPTGSDQGSKVTAGGDADASFFPGVKHAAKGVSSAFANQSALFQARTANQAITSGVLTAIVFQTFTSTPGYTPGLFGNPVAVQNPITFGNFGTALFTLIVDFAAANYDRYVEMTIANPDIAEANRSPRVRSQVSPDGDRLVLSAAIEGGSGAPATTVTANVFQASGVNRNITATWIAQGFHPQIFLT